MKTSEMVALAAAAGFAWWLVKSGGKLPSLGGLGGGTLKAQGDGKWHYYENGVSVDPSGNYFRDGVLIWSPYAHSQQ